MNRRARRASGSASRPTPRPTASGSTVNVCPDCAAPARAGSVRHADSCPLFAALEKITVEDAAWFKRNTGSRQRVRATTPAERSEQALSRPGITPDRQVTVIRHSKGTYIREFSPSGAADVLVVSGE